MNVYEMVTERIIEQLESGVIPWQKPWTGSKNGAYNRVSMKPYSILNQMLLQHSGEYIQNWLRVLRNDNKFIISSSSKSEKAVKYIFNENTVTE